MDESNDGDILRSFNERQRREQGERRHERDEQFSASVEKLNEARRT